MHFLKLLIPICKYFDWHIIMPHFVLCISVRSWIWVWKRISSWRLYFFVCTKY